MTRDRLLALLMDKQGEWISGPSLCHGLALTRSAVWKHACRLRQDGYVIESSPRKGYLFREAPDRLFPEELKRRLKTKVLGRRKIVYYTTTGSTNTVAKRLGMEGSPEGTLVIAEEQTGGRGRKKRTWYSPRHQGIYASLILRPKICLSSASGLALTVSVALARTLLALGFLDVRLKWPNDILLNGMKTAGMLIEMAAEPDAVDFMVIGLGLNVNTGSFPPVLRGKATSLLLQAGRTFSRIDILASCLESVECAYGSFKNGDTLGYFDQWKQLTDIIGREITIRLVDRTYSGVVKDLDMEGSLVLKDREGAFHRVFSGDLITSPG